MYCDYLCRVVQGNASKFQKAIIWKATQSGRLRLLKYVCESLYMEVRGFLLEWCKPMH